MNKIRPLEVHFFGGRRFGSVRLTAYLHDLFGGAMSTNHQWQLRLGVGCRQGDFRDDGLNGRAQVHEDMNMYEPGVAENETV